MGGKEERWKRLWERWKDECKDGSVGRERMDGREEGTKEKGEILW